MALALAFTSCRLRLEAPSFYPAFLSLSRNVADLDNSALQSDLADLQRSLGYSHRTVWLSGLLCGLIAVGLVVTCLRRELCPRSLAVPTLIFVAVVLIVPLLIIV